MSSSSSSPREAYEEDREYESQAKRLKTEEGEIDYSAEEGENRREATPRGGGDGGGRSFSQPVTKRGAPSAVPGGSREAGPSGGDSAPGLPPASFPFSAALSRLGSAGSSLWGFHSLPYLFSASRSRIGPGPAAGPGGSRLPALNLGRVAGRGRRRRVASNRAGGAGRGGGCGARLALC